MKKAIKPDQKDKPEYRLLYIEESLCIGCTMCKDKCKTDAISGHFLCTHKISSDRCVHCAQCLIACPTGAIKETRSALEAVKKALSDPKTKTAAIIAPSLGAGFVAANSIEGSLKDKGFDRVMSAEPGADLTIVDEGCEFVKRITGTKQSLLITSCCPALVRYTELFHPEITRYFTKTKSPVMMLGSIIKDYSTRKELAKDSDVFTAAVLPCIAKKHEASRPENTTSRGRDVDEVITSRELADMIKLGKRAKHKNPKTEKSRFSQLPESGGVLAEIIRFAHRKIAGREIANLAFTQSRLGTGIKETEISIKGIKVRALAASGLDNAEKVIAFIKNNPDEYQLVEILACPGGCVNGGGCDVNRWTLKKILARSIVTPFFKIKRFISLIINKENS